MSLTHTYILLKCLSLQYTSLLLSYTMSFVFYLKAQKIKINVMLYLQICAARTLHIQSCIIDNRISCLEFFICLYMYIRCICSTQDNFARINTDSQCTFGIYRKRMMRRKTIIIKEIEIIVP